MTQIQIVDGKAVGFVQSGRGITTESGWDWSRIEHAQQRAQEMSEATGDLHIAADNGKNCSPRFDVVRVPKVGDEVSRSFNGDSYPCGKISRVSKTYGVITTDTGLKFYRVDQTGYWRLHKTWWLVQGHIEERNPHF